MSPNPYASDLAGRDPIQAMRDTPRRIQAIVSGMKPADFARSYAPGKWNARQIMAHLADTEIVFAFRLRQARAEQHHVIQPFDQDLTTCRSRPS